MAGVYWSTAEIACMDPHLVLLCLFPRTTWTQGNLAAKACKISAKRIFVPVAPVDIAEILGFRLKPSSHNQTSQTNRATSIDHRSKFKMVSKKTKKTSESINARLALVMKSGKFSLGYKSTLKQLRAGKCIYHLHYFRYRI
jgi:hypothetical protein